MTTADQVNRKRITMTTADQVKLIQTGNIQTLTIPHHPISPSAFCDTIVSISCLLPSDCPMEETRKPAYLTLINALLTCPNGEAGQILQDNAELVDSGLVETMTQRAEILAEEGDENAANFLISNRK